MKHLATGLKVMREAKAAVCGRASVDRVKPWID
jgi:hypothetical protein